MPQKHNMTLHTLQPPKGADAAWFRQASLNYVAHTEQGRTVRSLAKQQGLHASTVSRQIRRISKLRSDPTVQLHLEALKEVADDNLDDCIAGAMNLTAKELQVLSLLTATDVKIILADGLEKAAVVKQEDPDIAPTTLARFPPKDILAIQAQGYLTRKTIGKLSVFTLSDAGFDALGQKPSVERAKVEPPLTILARRRDGAGHAFLDRELVTAGYHLLEDFRISEFPASVTHYEDILDHPRPTDRAKRAAVDRVVLALQDLGPGLGDIALRCCCLEQGIEKAEKELGWSARSGKIVLRIALQRLKRHYAQLYGAGGGMIG